MINASYSSDEVAVDWIMTFCWPNDSKYINHVGTGTPYKAWRYHFVQLAQTDRFKKVIDAMRAGIIDSDSNPIEIHRGFNHGREFILMNGHHRTLASWVLKVPTLEVVIVRAIRIE